MSCKQICDLKLRRTKTPLWHYNRGFRGNTEVSCGENRPRPNFYRVLLFCQKKAQDNKVILEFGSGIFNVRQLIA